MVKIAEQTRTLDPNDAYSNDLTPDKRLHMRPPSNVPFQTSVEIPGLQPHDEELLGREVRSGKLGKTLVEFRNRGLHTVFQPMPDKVVVWVGKHRPILGDKKVATSIGIGATAIAAGTVFLIRKSRQRNRG